MDSAGRGSGRQSGSTRALGMAGESAAADFLRRRGLEILARNIRSRLGEVDLVARDDRVLVFVEVKTRRGDPGDPPQAAVDARKQARLARVALGYLARHRLVDTRCRFDVVAVMLGPDGRVRRIDHFADAFAPGG